MELRKLPKVITDRLEERLNDEYTAHYHYTNAANYAESVGYEAFARFLRAEAAQELEHALKLQKFMNDWNHQPILKPIATPIVFSGFVDIVEKSYSIELDLLDSYSDDNIFYLEEKNMAVFNFTLPYVEIQNDSVAEYATLLNKLDLINKDDKSWIYQFQLEEFEA